MLTWDNHVSICASSELKTKMWPKTVVYIHSHYWQYAPNKYACHIVHTLGPRDYDLSVIMTWNLHGKYSPLTAILICPVIMTFYITFFFGDYNLKMSKITIFYINFFGNYNLKMSKLDHQHLFHFFAIILVLLRPPLSHNEHSWVK